MNAIAWLSASVGMLWLSTYAFGTLDIEALGFGLLALFFSFLFKTVLEAKEDWEDFTGRF